VRSKTFYKESLQRRQSPEMGGGGGGGSKSGADDVSPVASGRQEVEGGEGEVLRGGGFFTWRRETIKRGLGQQPMLFKGGSGVEQVRGGGGLRLYHTARRWGRVLARPAGGGRPATTRSWSSWGRRAVSVR
jgi:hypothetical protein